MPPIFLEWIHCCCGYVCFSVLVHQCAAVVLVEDPHIVDAFSNVCEQQEDTMSAQINEEVMAVATHTKKQLTDPEYLKRFCGPYVYTRIFLEVRSFLVVSLLIRSTTS